jgi:serine/threonine-protein kinase RIO1
LKKQRRERSARAHKWYEKEYAVLDKLYNRGISREEYERRVKIITDDLNGVAADDR